MTFWQINPPKKKKFWHFIVRSGRSLADHWQIWQISGRSGRSVADLADHWQIIGRSGRSVADLADQLADMADQWKIWQISWQAKGLWTMRVSHGTPTFNYLCKEGWLAVQGGTQGWCPSRQIIKRKYIQRFSVSVSVAGVSGLGHIT